MTEQSGYIMKQFLFQWIIKMVNLVKLKHSSHHNYQQIHLQGQVNVNGTRTIDHNLGYVPYVRVWAYHIGGELSGLVVPAASTMYHSAYETVSIITLAAATTKQLRLESSGALDVYYRIYLDAA